MLNDPQVLEKYYRSLELVHERFQNIQIARRDLVFFKGSFLEAQELIARSGIGKTSTLNLLPEGNVEGDRRDNGNLSSFVDNRNQDHPLYSDFDCQKSTELISSNSAELLRIRDKHKDDISTALFELGGYLARYGNLRKLLSSRIAEVNDLYLASLASLREELSSKQNAYRLREERFSAAKTAIAAYGTAALILSLLTGAITNSVHPALIIFAGCVLVSACLPLFYGMSLVSAFRLVASTRSKLDKLKVELDELESSFPFKEIELGHKKEQQESALRNEIEQEKYKAFKQQDIIHRIVVFTQHEVERILPNYLRQEWSIQKTSFLSILPELGRPLIPWSETTWHDAFSSPELSDQYSVYRIGDLLVERELGEDSLPALVALHSNKAGSKQNFSGHLTIYSNNDDSRRTALQAIESLAIRLVSSIHAKKIKVDFIDPISIGNTFSVGNFPDFIVGRRVITRDSDIREKVRALANHVEEITQNYLGRNYETIDDYNEESTSIIEPYRYLFIADFPTGFDAATVKDLKSLMKNGARAGVYVVLHVDDTQARPRDLRYDFFDDFCTVLRPSHGLNTGGSYQKKGSFKVGYIYLGRVTRILHSGAYVEFLPGQEGMLQTSNMTERKIRRPEEEVMLGKQIIVKVSSIDTQDRATLTCLGIKEHEAFSAACLAFQAEEYQSEGSPLFTIKWRCCVNRGCRWGMR